MCSEDLQFRAEGEHEPRFRGVVDAFENNFHQRREVGAAVAVTLHGRLVVDVWCGDADQAGTRRWQADTLANVYSATKGVVAVCVLQLAERGILDLDAPVIAYWPEFAQAGKDDVRVRWILSHRAGLPAIRQRLHPDAIHNWEAMTEAIAAERPWWTPGEHHGYHAMTFGWLAGELIRRTTGLSPGEYLAQRIARPAGLDFHIGLADAHHARAAELGPLAGIDELAAAEPHFARELVRNPQGMTALAYSNPSFITRGPNRAEWCRAEIPAANGHGTARALAQLYGGLATGGTIEGVHLLHRGTVEQHCVVEQSIGFDAVLQLRTRFSLGFMLSQPDIANGAFGPSETAFGHSGAGGSVGFADPASGIGFGYVTNRMGPRLLLDPRPLAIVDALYRALR